MCIFIEIFFCIYNFNRLSQKRPLQEDRRRVVSDFVNNELPGGKRRWQGSNGEPKTVFSRLSARVPSNNDDSADEDDNVIKVEFYNNLLILTDILFYILLLNGYFSQQCLRE